MEKARKDIMAETIWVMSLGPEKKWTDSRVLQGFDGGGALKKKGIKNGC
jgi:hypothetical protein